ncbi:MAG: DUF4160 domain-containing protein [Armatimonadota bacterium]
MPRISYFYGIAIYMYYREHQPPHFHVIYGDAEALISVESLAVIEGRLPGRALGLVIEWASLHQSELQLAWQQAMAMQPITAIEPLP